MPVVAALVPDVQRPGVVGLMAMVVLRCTAGEAVKSRGLWWWFAVSVSGEEIRLLRRSSDYIDGVIGERWYPAPAAVKSWTTWH